MKRIIRPKPDGLKIFVDGKEITDGVEYVEIDSQPTIPPHSLPSSASGSIPPVGPSTEDPSYRKQAELLAEALRIYGERNERYQDNWERGGWRGTLVRLRERVDRVWDVMWDADDDMPAPGYDIPGGRKETRAAAKDDLLDLINFAVFTIRAMDEGNRDGDWW